MKKKIVVFESVRRIRQNIQQCISHMGGYELEAFGQNPFAEFNNRWLNEDRGILPTIFILDSVSSDRLTFITEVRARAGKQPYIILFTDISYGSEAFEAGADLLLGRPCSDEDFMEALRSYEMSNFYSMFESASPPLVREIDDHSLQLSIFQSYGRCGDEYGALLDFFDRGIQ